MKQRGFVSLNLYGISSNPISISIYNNSWGDTTNYCVRVMFWFRRDSIHLAGASKMLADYIFPTFRRNT